MVSTAEFNDAIRRMENIVRAGTVAEVAYSPLRCRVASGKLTTDWLPCFTTRAGDIRTWSPPSAGEQCLIISPGGEMGSGMVLVGLNSDSVPEPESSPTVDATHYPDGAVIRYDHNAHALTAILPAGGTADITAPTSVTVHSEAITLDAPQTTTTGALTVQGLLTWQAGMAGSGAGPSGKAAVVDGSIHTTDDVTAGDISLTGHHHQGVHGATGGALA